MPLTRKAMIDANYFKSSKAVLCRVDLELKLKALAGANHENCGVNCRCIRFLSNIKRNSKIQLLTSTKRR